jgi:hypothetical protein
LARGLQDNIGTPRLSALTFLNEIKQTKNARLSALGRMVRFKKSRGVGRKRKSQ